MAFLRFDSGPRAGKRISLDKDRVTFGRHQSCDCVLKDRTVSREHFCVERVRGKYILVDRNSGNGTFANGSRISWVELKDGDRIQAGPFVLVAEIPESRETTSHYYGRDETATSGSAFNDYYEQVYPREYLEGIRHFNSRHYFEAHEIWEEIWLRSSGDTKIFYQMLIQAAVGLHHYERGNSRGARGMYKAVTEKLSRLPQVFMSLDLVDFSNQFKNFFAHLMDNESEAPPPADNPRPSINLLSDRAEN